MVKSFIIQKNEFLKVDTKAWYRCDYVGYGKEENPDYINVLKNTFGKTESQALNEALKKLEYNLKDEIREIIEKSFVKAPIAISIVPRSKNKNHYEHNQTLFAQMIKYIANCLIQENSNIIDGSNYIIRHTDTCTTHLANSNIGGGDGPLPYPGITRDTCHISDSVRGKNILLVDDTYTKTVNIDEDAIQALLDNGAVKVVFFAIARTKLRYH